MKELKSGGLIAPLTIQLFATGEPLPGDSSGMRLMRSGQLAQALVARGHRVTWISSQFDHFSKSQRKLSFRTELENNFELLAIRSPGYARNVSVQRLVDHAVLGWRALKAARLEPAPDVVVASFPPIEIALAAARLAKERACPLIVDVRDKWPDAILDLAPSLARPLARAALSPYFALTRRAMSRASRLTAHTPRFLDWAAGRAGRSATASEDAFPFCFAAPPQSSDAERHIVRASLGVSDDALLVVFAGTIGRQFDFVPVVDALTHLAGNSRIQIVLVGSGDQYEQTRAMFSECKNARFTGLLGRETLNAILAAADVGLCPYRNQSGFADSIPNKFAEYLSFGLPVLFSLSDSLSAEILTKASAGYSYDSSSTTLAKTLTILDEDRGLLSRMKTIAKNLFEREFLDSEVLPRFCAYIENVASAGRGGAAV